jgi:hypothetical protein
MPELWRTLKLAGRGIMAGVKITTTDLMQPSSQVMQGAVTPYNPAVGTTTNTLDGFIQILTRIERIINSPTVQPIFKRALEKWETQNNLGGQQQAQQVYNNPQIWEQPKAPAQKQIAQPVPTPQPQAPAQFTPEQLKKYFKTEDDVIKFIEELLNILPAEITTQEVGLFIQTYIGQLPNHKISEVKPLFIAMKPLIKKQLAPIYAKADTGVKGAEKGGTINEKTNSKPINGKN